STRNVFYLAQSYCDAGELEKAMATYQRRVDMGGWEQEVFWSLYKMGMIQEALEMPEQVISKSYAEAYRYRPCRIEPLYRLCYYYRRQNNFMMGYLIAGQGIHEQQPNDPLFVESWIYDYGLLLEYSVCAYWIGEYKEALIASQRILAKKNLPQHVKECVEK